MMQIMATETADHSFVVETTDAVNGKKQRVTVASEGDALRLAQVWNRLYILEKMTGWLHQRIFGLQIVGSTIQLTKAFELLSMLEGRRCAPIQSLRQFIISQDATIRFIAPSPKSVGQYKYYQNTIQGICTFCREMEGEPAI